MALRIEDFTINSLFATGMGAVSAAIGYEYGKVAKLNPQLYAKALGLYTFALCFFGLIIPQISSRKLYRQLQVAAGVNLAINSTAIYLFRKMQIYGNLMMGLHIAATLISTAFFLAESRKKAGKA